MMRLTLMNCPMQTMRAMMSEHATLPVVAFLGPAGTYSHAAAMQLFPAGAEFLPAADIQDVFSLVEQGRALCGVVPVENSSEGSVLPTLDSFIASPVRISAETLLRISHCFIVAPGSDTNRIQRIASHQQSLGQCRQWLRQHYPDAELVPMSSNAEAARYAAGNPGVGAIAGRSAAELYGLQIVHESIEDASDNTTRFLKICLKSDTRPSGHDKTSLIIKAHNEPGTLFRALEPFHRFGVSLTKLESRPSRKTAWSYLFYVDLEGHVEDAPVSAALNELARLSIEVEVLGSYPAAVNT
jgi:chorismate mutase / prephenate dehydratase